jgi:hypothetical protein
MPQTPEHGIESRTPFGPHCLYYRFKYCKRLAEQAPQITIGEAVFDVKACRVAPKVAEVSLGPKLTKILSVHISVCLDEGFQFRAIKPWMVKEALKGIGLVVLRSNRSHAKIGGQTVRHNSTQGGYLHFNVMPIDTHLSKFDFPPLIRVQVKANRFTDAVRTEFLKYYIEEHPEIGRRCLTGCHKPLPTGVTVCPCVEEKRDPQKQVTARPKARDLLNGLMQEAASTSQEPCQHFALGRCFRAKRGAQCGAGHPAEIDPFTIQCKLATSKNGMCSNGKWCCYNHGELQTNYGDGDTVQGGPMQD